MRILVTESLGDPGLEILAECGQLDVVNNPSPAALIEMIPGYEALIVRSRTRVTADVLDAGSKLKVVGRAGTGVDNIDLDAATKHGVFVVNAPTGNSNAVAEHTIALMLALARRIHPAVNSLKQGRWEKSSLQGNEVLGKTLGLIGLGRIGSLVASKAKGLDMRVIAHDPYASPERAASSGVELVSLDTLLGEADFVSVHTPLTPQTKGLVDAEKLALLKPTAYVINCARGGIVNEAALEAALREERIAGAALDVFEQEPATEHPLIELPNVIATPHVGASTNEAQENVARDVALSVKDVLEGRMPANPVNVPYLPPQAADFLAPYIDLAERLGSLFLQWRGELSDTVELIYDGDLCEHDTQVLTSAFLAGLLGPAYGEPVNIVNVQRLAAERGLVTSEVRRGHTRVAGNLITARYPDADADQNVSGTLVRDEPHLVALDGQRLDCVLQGHMLVDLHHDRPGIVGRMGLILGERDINISFVQMSRAHRGGPSIMILGLDDPADEAIMEQVVEVPNVQRVRMVSLPTLPGYQEPPLA
jgi:D-3-phosphoglycerate dehydrogenase